MIKVNGAFNSAIVYSDLIDPLTETIIKLICASPLHSASKIRIMPDVSQCRGCVIGTTMTIDHAIIPGHVGKDSGCGLIVQNIDGGSFDFHRLDKLLYDKVVSREGVIFEDMLKKADLKSLTCYHNIDIPRIEEAFCRIGHGNHFIEVNEDDKGAYKLVIHSGSSALGFDVLKYYQRKASNFVNESKAEYIKDIKQQYMKALGPLLFDAEELNELNDGRLPKWYCWLEGEDKESFLHDIDIVQDYARLNREAMVQLIAQELGLSLGEYFHCNHNYIDTVHNILHKGSVSAQLGERVIIPINMKAGSMLCTGKGNPDYNYSAPHGVGKKVQAPELDLESYIADMAGIHATTVSTKTLGESPRAYKDLDQVIGEIKNTVNVEQIIKPLYNYKEADKRW